MGLHQDRDEADFEAPILSLSLGADCRFRLGGPKRADKTIAFTLSGGDALVLSGPARRCFHGVDRILPSILTPLPGAAGGAGRAGESDAAARHLTRAHARRRHREEPGGEAIQRRITAPGCVASLAMTAEFPVQRPFIRDFIQVARRRQAGGIVSRRPAL